jgi:SAM-dependent methyltransferase
VREGVAPVANVDMAEAWDGEEGDDWTENAERYEATDRYLQARFEQAQQLRPTDIVLDVGCGTGASTLAAARVVTQGRVIAVDLSTRMLTYASDRARCQGVDNVEFLRADVQVHPFDRGSCTVAISTFGTMFFNDPVADFSNIGRALKRDGRLVMTVWRRFEDNEWLRSIFAALDSGRSLTPPQPGQPGPFGLAERARIEQVLGDSGWGGVDIEPIDEPMWLGTDADDAWAFVSGMGIVRGLTAGLDDRSRDAALTRLRQLVNDAASLKGAVTLRCAAWLVTATIGDSGSPT